MYIDYKNTTGEVCHKYQEPHYSCDAAVYYIIYDSKDKKNKHDMHYLEKYNNSTTHPTCNKLKRV